MNPNGLTAECHGEYDPGNATPASKILEMLCDHFTKQFGVLPDDADIAYLEAVAENFSAGHFRINRVLVIKRGSLDAGVRIIQ